MAKVFLCAPLLVLLAALAASPQQPADQAPIDDSSLIKVDVDLVNVLCTVHDKHGGLIGNLEKNNFRLFEDGKEQEIKYFTRETDLPLTIGLLVDTSGSQERLIEVERRAASQFFEKVLRKQDLAFLISFGKDSELLQDSTSSARLLQDGLSELRLNANVGGLQPGPVPTLQNTAGTVLYDAIFLASDEKLRQEVGRKVIVVITDGQDYGSKMSRNDAIEAAQKADAVIYSIYYSDGMFGGSDGDLKRMSEETGGRVLKVDKNHSLDDIFQEIQDDMRSQYAIGYSPTNGVKDGSYRKIEFKMSDKNYKVQARKGYYAIENDF